MTAAQINAMTPTMRLLAMGLSISGGAGQDTASFDSMLKTVYESRWQNLIPTVTKLYDRFEQLDAAEYGGRLIEGAIKITRTQGVGAYAEMGAPPGAGRAKYAPVRINMKYLGGRVQFSAQVIEQSKGAGRNAFASVMESEMDDLLETIQSDCGRIAFSDGRGVLAICNGAPTSATVAVKSPAGFAGATNGARFMNEGMLVGVINPVTGALRASSIFSVLSVASDGTTVTLSGSLSGVASDGDYLVRANNSTATDVSDTSYQKEPMGLAGLIDDGTYVATLHAVNRTLIPNYQSTIIANAGTWSSDVIQRAIDVAVQTGGANITELWMHMSSRRAYVNSMEADRRYTGGDLQRPDQGTVAAKGGKLTFGSLPIEEDRYHPYNTVFMPDWSSAKKYNLEKGKWEDRDGSVLRRLGSGSTFQHGFEAFYYVWFQMALAKPNQSARVDGLSTSIVPAHLF